MQVTNDDVLLPRVLLSVYNGVVNLLWSLLAFAPVSIFCFRFMERAWLWTFVAASAVGFIMPASTLRYLELGSTVTIYRRLGVPWVNHFVQHGTLVNQWVRRRDPEYQPMQFRTRIPQLLQSTYLQERFHWIVLLFFLLSSLHAVTVGHPVWALLITIMNVVYNLYPIWLQQYIRVRLNRSCLGRVRTA